MSYLMHYGKGHLDGGHSGRYPYGSGERPYQSDPPMSWLDTKNRKASKDPTKRGAKSYLPKGSNVVMYSGKREGKKASVKNKTATASWNDMGEMQYYEALMKRRNLLGNKTTYRTEVSAVKKATVLRGKAAVYDLIQYQQPKKFFKRTYEKNVKLLDKAGYLDDSLSTFDRKNILDKSKKLARAQMEAVDQANVMLATKGANGVNSAIVNKYANMGYDAVVNAEDFLFGYEAPLIIVNDKAFKRTSTEKIIEPYGGGYKTKKIY